jgi:hypothetical protein
LLCIGGKGEGGGGRVEIEKEKSSERGRAWEGRGVEVSIQQGKVDRKKVVTDMNKLVTDRKNRLRQIGKTKSVSFSPR